MKLSWLVPFLCCTVNAQASQVPLSKAHHTRPPPANSTHNLLFDSISSLLHRWPNTRYRNGHTVVPGTIPAGTLLYHGTHLPTPPQGPEWIALDPEHSYLFTAYCNEWDPTDGLSTFASDLTTDNSSQTEPGSCWHLTFAATRPLRVLYFDGSSASKLPILLRNRKPKKGFHNDESTNAYPLIQKAGGPLDSQDILTWGRIRQDMISRDRTRIQEMCDKWGRGGSEIGEDGEGFDGFVRMEMSFEVMLCDFTSTTHLISASALASSAPPTPDPQDPPPSSITTALIQTGSWHNHSPGESRIVLDLAHLFSFFDTNLAPSLVPIRAAGQQRWEHRIQGISEEDVARAKKALQNVIVSKPAKSNIDWKALFQAVKDRYAERLETLRDVLDAVGTSPTSELEARKAQSILRIILTPYIQRSVFPPSSAFNTTWASPVFKLCSTVFTDFLYSCPALTEAEILMRESIFHTNEEICRVVTRMWAQGVELGLDPVLNPRRQQRPTSSSATPSTSLELEQVFKEWDSETKALMRWLDWSVWVKCRPACGTEEMCYLPTWPLLDPIPTQAGTSEHNHWGEAEIDWLDPKPRCVRKVMPYEL